MMKTKLFCGNKGEQQGLDNLMKAAKTARYELAAMTSYLA
jgi:hypothetical protein